MRCAHGLNIIKRAVCQKTRPFPFPFQTSSSVFVQTRCYRTRKSPATQSDESQLKDETTLVAAASREQSAIVAPISPDPVPKPKRGRKPRATKPSPSSSDLFTTQSRISQNHNDLASFLAYADSTALPPTTTVYVGTHYEYLVSASVARLGFSMTRVGGASDLGIDLLGHWSLPSLPHSLPAIIQCKATAPQAVFIRELEGAMQSAPAGWQGDNVIALLAASKVATKGVRDAIARSSYPMAFLYITAEDGMVRQFLWNQAAVIKCGLEGVGVGLRYPEESVALTWQGVPWDDLSIKKKKKKEKKKKEDTG